MSQFLLVTDRSLLMSSQAKILTDTDDIMARLASTQPMYIRDDAAASALTDAIDELIDCDTSPAGGVTE